MVYGVILIFLLGELSDARVGNFDSMQQCQVALEEVEVEMAAGSGDYSVLGACLNPNVKRVDAQP